MMRPRAVFVSALVTVVMTTVLSAGHVSATALRIAPLNYETTLKKGETQKGFVDISNPEPQAVTVRLEAQAFRQIDDKGNLEFYASEQVAAGVKLDLTQVELAPHGAMRVFFVLDSAKLPTGDVFGAIMASTVPKETTGSAQSVRVGTLLMVVNQTPSSHQADVSQFSANWFQVGDKITAHIRLTNPADAKSATGFFPSVAVAARPYNVTTVKGPLLFAGRTRDVEFSQTANYFGPIYLQATSGGGTKGSWVFAVTGYWRWLVPLLLGVLCAVFAALHWRKNRRASKKHN